MLKEMLNRLKGGRLLLAVLFLPFLGLGAQAPSDPVVFDAFLTAAEKPVVQVFTFSQEWRVAVKPEFRGNMEWGRTLLPSKRLVKVDAGATFFTVKPQADELFPPAVWLDGGKVQCAVPASLWVGFKKESVTYPNEQDCDRLYSVKDTLTGGELMNRAAADAIAVIHGRYQFQIEPQSAPTVFEVSYGSFAHYGSFAWSLDQMQRIDTDNLRRVDEQTAIVGRSGTGTIVYSGPLQTMQKAGRDGMGNAVFQRVAKDYQYDKQTLILTNAHVVGPVLQGGVWGVKDEETGALVEAGATGQSWVYVILQPGGKMLDAQVVAADVERDLAWLSLNEPLEVTVPPVRWGNVNEPLKSGEEVWMVGHPLGIPTPIPTKGIAGHMIADDNLLRQNIVIDGRGGSSGSPLYRAKNGLPEIIGVVFAMYGEYVVADGPAIERHGEPLEKPVDWAPGPQSFDPDAFMAKADYHVAGSNFMLAISLKDIVASAAENGLDIAGLSGQFQF